MTHTEARDARESSDLGMGEGGLAVSRFTPHEIAYLESQPLGRLGTVNRQGELHLVPVGFRYDPETDSVEVGSRHPGLAASRKFRDIQATGRVVFLVDDVLANGPDRQLRAVEIRGVGEALPTGGERMGPNFEPQLIRIHPRRIVSWGINAPGYSPESRAVE
jgi:pyridoxamine 5'-phosphate oxidase family protein